MFKKLLSIFNRNSHVMSVVRADALIATTVVTALMAAPVLPMNATLLQVLIYVQGGLMFITKKLPIGDGPKTPPAPPVIDVPAAPQDGG